ncbi:MAG: ABC transporter permease [Burkholderiales bacterium]|nr:ABC transporter permease [Burkholderiales bacterium]
MRPPDTPADVPPELPELSEPLGRPDPPPAAQGAAADRATLDTATPGLWQLGGAWTLRGLGSQAGALAAEGDAPAPTVLDGAGLTALDSAGAWVLQRRLRGLGGPGGPGGPDTAPALRGWPPRAQTLMHEVGAGGGRGGAAALPQPPRPGLLQRTGRAAVGGARKGRAFVAFVGEVALAAAAVARRPRRLYGRAVLHEIEIGGFDALPIIGLTAFLLGVVVAYQGADQLRHYGANVFVVELVGYAMLREFAPLISAIIIAGRSGSAHAAQLGTMVVSDEIDAMRTLGIDPMQRLVLPKILALAVALPLLTVFADLAGVLGGMTMARAQLGIGFPEFVDRFGRTMQGSALLIGVGKAFVFAFIIVLVGCFQGLRAGGGADSVGRQTTATVVQAIFLVISADAVFSVAFNLIGL